MAATDQQSAGKVQGRPENLTNAGKGRVKGVPNKTTTQLKEAILEAAANAGGEEKLVGYLTKQADENPTAFMSLLGKVLPMTIAGDDKNPLTAIVRIERVIVDPKQ